MSEKNLVTANQTFLKPLKEFEKKQNQLVKENPFIEIKDNKTFESAKKSRTALLKGRTELQNQQKAINNKVNTIKTAVKEETERLIEITRPAEDKQQIEVKRHESIQEEKRLERERLEQEKKDEIKSQIDDIISDWNDDIKKLTFKRIDKFKENMVDYFGKIDASSFEDLEIYYSGQFASLKITLETKVNELEKDQELLVSQSENRFQQFRNKWMERLIDANINNIEQLNKDFEEVKEIDPESFFSFNSIFVQEVEKLSAKLIDITNHCKLQQDKADEQNRILEIKNEINEIFDNQKKTIEKTIFEDIIKVAGELSKSHEDFKNTDYYKEYQEIIDLNISHIEKLAELKFSKLAGEHQKFQESEKKRLSDEKKELKKNDVAEKARQKKLEPEKKKAIETISSVKIEIENVQNNKEIDSIMSEFYSKLGDLQQMYTNKINEL